MVDEDEKEKEGFFEPEPANFPVEESIALYQIWDSAQNTFITTITRSLETLRKSRTQFTSELKLMQTSFLEFLYRSTDK